MNFTSNTQGQIQEFLLLGGKGGGGGPNFGSERTVTYFVANSFSQRRPLVSQSVNDGRRRRGKYCFASGGEQIIGGHPKTITFFNIPGI